MTNPLFPFKLPKGRLLLLHMAAAGHVWRDERGFWVATTPKFKRNVHLRIVKLVHLGYLKTDYKAIFPTLTERGRDYLNAHPLSEVIPGAQLTDLTRV
jgi:hypothetical protein